jgi:hypothetical protein
MGGTPRRCHQALTSWELESLKLVKSLEFSGRR